jgi:hypothetical protein
MNFAHFPQANTLLKAAPGTEHYVQDLPIYRPQPYVVSCVELSAQELAQVVASRRIYLQLDGMLGTLAETYLHCLKQFSMMADFYDAATAEPMLVSFEGANAGEFVFMQPLPGHQLPTDSHPCAVGCFEFTETEARRISATGKVYVKALGHTHAPICVHASNPVYFSAPVPEQDQAAKALTNLEGQAN